MKTLNLMLASGLSFLVLAGCTGGGFKSALSNIGSSGSLGDGIAKIEVTAPLDQARIRSEVTVSGTCTPGMQVSITGDLNQLLVLMTPCEDGSFSTLVQVSAGDGPKNLRISQTGSNGMESLVLRTVIRDNGTPALAIVAPTANQNVRSSTVVQGTCETGIEVEITENGQTYRVPCTNAMYATTLPLASADGIVTITVAQMDSAGNRVSLPVNVRKDTFAPNLTITAPAANADVSSQANVTGTCENSISVQVSGSGVSAPALMTCASGAFSIPIVFTAGAGSKEIQVSQTDLAGNTTALTRSFNRQVDAAPAIAITGPTANSIFRNNVTLTGTCVTGLTVNFSGAGWSAPASTTCSNGMFSAQISFTNGDGTKNIIASQTNAQNLTGSASRSFVRDNTAPPVTIASPAANSFGRTSITLAGACENGITVQIAGAGATAQTANCVNGMYSSSVNFSSGEGSKTITVSQTDAVGNLGSASRNFTRDSIAPAVTITSPAADTSAETGVRITGTCEGTFTVMASGSGLSSGSSIACASNAYTLDVNFSSGDGAKSVQIAQTDAAGNMGSVTRNFVKHTPSPVIDGPALYAQNCAACHGALATSAKQNRTASQISTAITGVAQMNNLNFLSSAQREAIAQALYVAPSQPAFACNPNDSLESKAVVKNVRRLSRRQYINTLSDLLSRSFSASAASTLVNAALNGVSLPVDDDTQFSRFDTTVIRQHMKAYFDVADALGQSLVNSTNYSTFISGFINLDRGSCTSVSTTALTSECATRFIANFGRRALRRPLINNGTINEPSSFMTTYNAAGGNAAGINAVVFRFLMDPQFLYHVEADGALVSGRLYRLSSHAVANRLSYMFWNSMPDETLLSQAASGNLADNAAFTTALNYVSDHAKAQDSMREFTSEWLKLRHVPNFQTNNPSLNYLAQGITLDASLRSAMIEEVQELGSYVYRNNLTLNDLFMTDINFARDSRLMNIYGATAAAPATVTPQNAQRLPAGTRSGILTRAALVTGGSELANPIKRGIRVRKDILCLNLDNPPAELEDALEPPAPDINMTTRQRYDNATSPAVCMNCHQHINSLGHGLSAYNSFGRYGTQEPTFDTQGMFSGRYLPINTQVDLSISLGSGLSASNASDLSNLIANHRNTRICVSEKALKFAEGRDANRAKEGCRLNNMYNHLVQAHSLKDFMKSVAQDSEFRHRLLGQ